MHLIFAKLYEEYLKEKGTAKVRITSYITLFYFLLAFVIMLPIQAYLKKKLGIDFSNFTILISVFGSLAIIMTLVRLYYVKNNYIEELASRYKKRKINKFLLYLFTMLIIPTLLLLAGAITVLINGGEILGNKIEGLIQ